MLSSLGFYYSALLVGSMFDLPCVQTPCLLFCLVQACFIVCSLWFAPLSVVIVYLVMICLLVFIIILVFSIFLIQNLFN